ncbi:MAG: cytochrome c biogenesis protein CcdA, partial [Gaiellales bacterium]
ILTIAAGGGDPTWGALLLIVYGIGLGLPFLAGAIALERISGISRRLRRHARTIQLVSGSLLLLLGVLIATGGFGQVTAHLARTVPDWLL